ncbi:MAG: hypothetical protein E7447_05950 [Ruminococcaceae bacterium]|nr:hypothetical protein [Oscillospiraceae bacterium]
MKKLCVILVMMLLLTGCSLQTFEKVEDQNDVQAMASPAKFLLDLPETAAAPAMQSGTGKIYFCGDYDIAVEILPSGNLSNTLQTLTGYEKEELELVKTVRSGVACYEGVWSAAGEAGDHIGRVLVLDDGNFHYCVSILAPAETAGECVEEWNTVLSSVALAEG